MNSLFFFQSKGSALDIENASLKDANLHQRKRIAEMITSLMKDLNEIGSVLGGNTADARKPSVGSSEKIEEEFTVARLYVSKMKSEVKTLVGRCGNLEDEKKKVLHQIESQENALSEARLLVQQVGNAVSIYLYITLDVT